METVSSTTTAKSATTLPSFVRGISIGVNIGKMNAYGQMEDCASTEFDNSMAFLVNGGHATNPIPPVEKVAALPSELSGEIEKNIANIDIEEKDPASLTTPPTSPNKTKGTNKSYNQSGNTISNSPSSGCTPSKSRIRNLSPLGNLKSVVPRIPNPFSNMKDGVRLLDNDFSTDDFALDSCNDGGDDNDAQILQQSSVSCHYPTKDGEDALKETALDRSASAPAHQYDSSSTSVEYGKAAVVDHKGRTLRRTRTPPRSNLPRPEREAGQKSPTPSAPQSKPKSSPSPTKSPSGSSRSHRRHVSENPSSSRSQTPCKSTQPSSSRQARLPSPRPKSTSCLDDNDRSETVDTAESLLSSQREHKHSSSKSPIYLGTRTKSTSSFLDDDDDKDDTPAGTTTSLRRDRSGRSPKSSPTAKGVDDANRSPALQRERSRRSNKDVLDESQAAPTVRRAQTSRSPKRQTPTSCLSTTKHQSEDIVWIGSDDASDGQKSKTPHIELDILQLTAPRD